MANCIQQSALSRLGGQGPGTARSDKKYGGSRRWNQQFEYSSESQAGFVERSPHLVAQMHICLVTQMVVQMVIAQFVFGCACANLAMVCCQAALGSDHNGASNRMVLEDSDRIGDTIPEGAQALPGFVRGSMGGLVRKACHLVIIIVLLDCLYSTCMQNTGSKRMWHLSMDIRI